MIIAVKLVGDWVPPGKCKSLDSLKHYANLSNFLFGLMPKESKSQDILNPLVWP